jgi:hypothetical protein
MSQRRLIGILLTIAICMAAMMGTLYYAMAPRGELPAPPAGHRHAASQAGATRISRLLDMVHEADDGEWSRRQPHLLEHIHQHMAQANRSDQIAAVDRDLTALFGEVRHAGAAYASRREEYAERFRSIYETGLGRPLGHGDMEGISGGGR